MIRRSHLVGAAIVMSIVTSACVTVDTSQDGPNPGGDTGAFSSTRSEGTDDITDLDALRADIERTAVGTVEYLVTDTDTLAIIAERVCGDVGAWDDIFEANRGRLQPNGTPFDDPNTLQPGWRLEVVCTVAAVADQVDLPPVADTPAPAASTYVVQSGDTLASIAVDQCGTEGAWLDIFEANQPLPDGTPFDDENRLQAGWVIRIDCG